ncbi:hypothetical protein Zmor_013185 [Zophobas morio]|uniref:Uncharacterized protein n=1 Tax=Zophobas morio TaxID=2755281 RepID=A0AA38IGZ2_9CUCU|nr:hypothetical protein Zmor_013185 [Zophobas morio]
MSRGQKYRRGLKLAAKQDPVENVFKTYLSKDAKISTRLTAQKERKNLVVRTMRNQEHPMAQRGLLGFPMERINTGNAKTTAKGTE